MDTAPHCRIDYCSFCHASQSQAWLIAGPGRADTPERKLICDHCVARATALLTAPPSCTGSESIQSTTGEMIEITAKERICSFCHKRRAKVRRLLGGPGDAAICNECIWLCDEIVSETNARR